jgi:hypothetical protein
MRRSIRSLPVIVQAATIMVLSVACEEKKQPSSEGSARTDAGAGKYATADPKLEKALQAAAASSSAADRGPPAQGVFAAGAADQRHPKGTSTTVDLVSDGDEPRVNLAAPTNAPSDATRRLSYGNAILDVATQMGPRAALPTVDLTLALGPAKKEDSGGDWLVADIRKAIPAKEQYGQLPPGTEREIASLEGTELRVKVTPDGRTSEEQVLLGKATRPDLETMAKNAAEALVLLLVPLPSKAVGVGAQWIAETRMPWWGVDVIAYRAFRVKGIEGERVSLTLSTQVYAVTKETQLQGVPKGGTLEQFDGQAQGEMELVRGEFLPRKATLEQRVAMFFRSPAAEPSPAAATGAEPQGTMLAAKFQGEATFLRGDDLRGASRK